MPVNNSLTFIGLFVYLYLTTTVAAFLEIKNVGTASSLLIVILALYSIATIGLNITVKNFKSELFIILVGILIIALKIINNDYTGVQQVIFFILVPMLVSILLQSQHLSTKKSLSKLIIFFYLTECLLALYERIFLINIFPYEESIGYSEVEFLGFRSTALLGHPLQNALCVSTIMGFILITRMRLNIKIPLITLGYVALLCFNARGATLIWSILFPVYFSSILFKSQRKELLSLSSLSFLALATVSIIYLVITHNFGDRLFNDTLIDESALSRIEVYSAFLFINNNDFWFGNSQNYTTVMDGLGAGGVENSFLVIIINYGIIMGLIVIFIYIAWLKKVFRIFKGFQVAIILISFILVGSLNNSLASQLSWAIFIACCNTLPYINIHSINSDKSQRSPQ